MLVQQACDQFLIYSETTKKLSLHSIKAYRRDLETFKVCAGSDECVSQITRATINRFVDLSFSNGLSPRTVKRRLACLKTLFKWLENEGVIEDTPFRRFDLKVRVPQRLPRNLSSHELSKLLNAARSNLGIYRACPYERINLKNVDKKNINDLTTLVCIELLFTTGIRVGELTEISLADIYINERYIHIRGKGQRERRVFLIDENIQNLLGLYLELRMVTSPSHQQLLVNRLGRPATTQIVRIWLKKISQAANLNRGATPHMYRHSAATELLNSGVDIVYVQKLLGHQSISTTQIYTHVNHDDVFRNISQANIRRKIL